MSVQGGGGGEGTQSVPVFVCLLHGIKALTDKSSLRLRVNVKSVLHYPDLEDLHLFT